MIAGLDILFGGATGLVGNLITTWFKFKNTKLEYEHDTKIVELESKMPPDKGEVAIKITGSKIDTGIKKEDDQTCVEPYSYGPDKMFYEKWINELREAGKNSGKWTKRFYNFLAICVSAAFAFVDLLNTLMRPVLTLYLVCISSYITILSWRILKLSGIESLSADQAVLIFQQVTSTMIYLTVSSVTWWFGDRTMVKFFQEKDNRRKKIKITPTEIKE